MTDEKRLPVLMPETYESALTKFFGEEAERNADVFAGALQESGVLVDPEMHGRLSDTRPDPIQVAAFKDQESGFIRIQHGWHGDDYVWHIAPLHPKRPWRASIEAIIRLIAQTMNAVIPSEVSVRIWKPRQDWELKEITFKAFELKSHWAITDQVMDDLAVELFRILNQAV